MRTRAVRRSIPLRWRLLLLVLAAAAPFVVLIAMTARTHLRSHEQRALLQVRAEAVRVAERIDDRLLGIEAQLRRAGTGQPPRPGRSPLALRDVHVVPLPAAERSRADGEVWYGSPEQRDREWVVPVWLRAGESAATAFVPLSVLALPIVPRIDGGATIVVADTGGRILSASERGAKLVGTRAPARVRQLWASGERAVVDSSLFGDERIVGVSALTHAPWRVAAGLPASVVRRAERVGVARAIGWGALALLLALGLALWQAQRLIAPLRELADHARDLARGDLGRRTGVDAPDELGELAVTMDHMAAALAEREDALAASESRYRTLFDLNPSPMMVFDAETYAIKAVNDAAIEKYGYDREEFLRLTAEEIRPEEDRESFRNFMRGLGGNDARGTIRRHRRKDGTVMHVEIHSREVMFDGRRSRVVVANDVSERVQSESALRTAEERLVRAQRLEAVGQLTGGIAHDFNNVLMAIRSYGELLLSSFEEHDQRRDDVLEILRAQERASTLTRQLLAFSRSQVLQPRVLDLNVTLSELGAFIERLLGEDVQLALHMAPEPVLVRADPAQLTQVFINLAVNARDAMPDGGVLSIGVTRHEVPEDELRDNGSYTLRAGTYARLVIGDTGVGMPKEVQSRIFEPFFTTKPVGKGTGMGLSTVYGVVKQSGGYIFVESVPGVGTTFTILLPLATGAPDAPETVDHGDGDKRGTGTLLVVEDEAPLRTAIARMLRDAGYNVLAADDGYDALGMLAERDAKIDLVITDLVMPNMGGLELVERLRARGPVRALFMTGYTKDAKLRAELQPGAKCLQKPFTRSELLDEVRATLESSEAEDE